MMFPINLVARVQVIQSHPRGHGAKQGGATGRRSPTMMRIQGNLGQSITHKQT